MSTPSYIKCREIGDKTWVFLSRGGTNHLRVHALRFATAERAQAVIDENAADNPEWEWKVVAI